MRHSTVLIVVLSLLFLTTCQNNKPTNQGLDKYDTIAKELNSGTVIDTIFLGYRFGMSEQEIEKHTKELVKKKKLRTKLNGYSYRFILNKYFTVDGHLEFEYFQNRLKELRISFTDEVIGDTIMELLIEKYKEKYISKKQKEERAKYFETDGYGNDKYYDFIKDNLDISFLYSSDDYNLIISYIDGRIQKEEDKYKEKEAKNQIEDL